MVAIMKIYGISDKSKAIIFDIDNTLYRNPEYVKDQRDRLLGRFAQEKKLSFPEAKEMIESCIKQGSQAGANKTSMGNAFLAYGIPISQSVAWREELCCPEQFLTADAELIKTLKELAKRYILLAVTNNPRQIGIRTLSVLGVASFFTSICGLDDTGVSKPAAEPFIKAADDAGAEPSDIISVGDRYEIDIAVPLSMGMGGILVESMDDVYRLPAVLAGKRGGHR
jgi:FMN phosphatase YigB (HAD superfamily)